MRGRSLQRGGRGGGRAHAPGRGGRIVWPKEKVDTSGVDEIDLSSDLVKVKKQQLTKWCSEKHPSIKSIFEKNA